MTLWWLLPRRWRDTVAGDLEEIWQRGTTTRWTWWRLAAASVVACWVDALRSAPSPDTTRTDEGHGDHGMSTFLQDIAYGWRLMRRSPGFTTAAVLTIALGIGVNAATFSIVDVLSLKPLSYRAPERVAFILNVNADRRQPTMSLPLPDAIDIRTHATSLEDVGAYQYWSANITGGGRPERIQAYRVTGNMFPLLGVDAALGRALVPDDGRPDAPDAVVLSDGLWRRLGSDRSIVGRQVALDGVPHTVVGVMPARFEFPVFNFKGEAWAPMKGTAEGLADRQNPRNVVAIARLKPGVAYGTARAELGPVMKRLETAYPVSNRGMSADLVEMRRLSEIFQPAPISAIALSAVAVVLLLACANVANLLLARGIARERELAVRAALGAGRRRLLRQLLTESVLIALAGSALGLAFAFWTLRLLHGAIPELLIVTLPNVLELGIDRTTMLFTVAVTCLSTLIFGGLPAWRIARHDTSDSLKAGGTTTSGPRHQRVRAGLMVAQVALAVTLLVTAGLLVRAFAQLRHVDTGFVADDVLTMTVSLPAYKHADAAAQRRFFQAAADAVAAVPGVTSAAFTNVLPFSTYNEGRRYVVDGGAPPELGREPSTAYRIVTDHYFRTLGIPLVAGRAFDSQDRDETQRVAIVNQTFARRAFGDAPAVGRRFRFGRADAATPWNTVVGVVGDVRHSELTGAPEAEAYVPLAQRSGAMMMLAARTAGGTPALIDPVRQAIASIDPMQPVYDVKTLRDLVDQALLPHTSATSMMAVFASLALVLAAVGIYGVVAYSVNAASREFGVRLALGATPADLIRGVLRRGLSLVSVGAVIGIAAALGVTRLLGGMLYGVTASDPITYLAVAGGLLVVAGAACYIPARRVSRLDPSAILRAE